MNSLFYFLDLCECTPGASSTGPTLQLINGLDRYIERKQYQGKAEALKAAGQRWRGQDRTVKSVDVVDLIMAFEEDSATYPQILDLFGELIRTGQAWRMNGSYGRHASTLITMVSNGGCIARIRAEEEGPEGGAAYERFEDILKATGHMKG